MPKFSERSEEALKSCAEPLQRLFREVIKSVDCTVVCGARSEEAQKLAVASGLSKTPWPESKHNSSPSLAVDVAPWPLDWSKDRALVFAGFVLAMAEQMGIKVRWGGAWGGWSGGRIKLNPPGDLQDLDHFELMESENATATTTV